VQRLALLIASMVAATSVGAHCRDNIPGSARSGPWSDSCSRENPARILSAPGRETLHEHEFAREAPRVAGRTDAAPAIASARIETDHLSANRWGIAGTGVGGNVDNNRDAADSDEAQSPVSRSLSQLHFADSHDWIHNPPEILKEIRNYRHQGVPIIHLVESRETMVAIGVSNHGKPGLYFTRNLPF
jgi:hypothetical protein